MSANDPQREPDQLQGILLPEQAPELIGHKAAFDTLVEQNRTGHLPGAILLHGPRGIGKASLAFTLAKHILSETGDEPAERVAEQIAAGVHPNIFTLRRRPRDSSGFYAAIRVEDVRDVQLRMRQTRGRAGYRICVVDSIDDCNQNSANALLKILEEPPAETLFLLVSHRPGALLPTIRSRCHAYALRGLVASDVEHIIMNQMPNTENDVLHRAVDLAEGRPQRAFEALMIEGLETLDTLQRWLSAPGTQPAGVYLQLADAVAKAGGAEAAFAREMLIGWVANEARAAATAGPGARNRLASATDLWDKAHAVFADADAYNLDARQTLVSIFDALRQHARLHMHLAPDGQS